MSDFVSSIVKGLLVSGGGALIAALTPLVTPVETDPKSIVVAFVAANVVNFLRKYISK